MFALQPAVLDAHGASHSANLRLLLVEFEPPRAGKEGERVPGAAAIISFTELLPRLLLIIIGGVILTTRGRDHNSTMRDEARAHCSVSRSRSAPTTFMIPAVLSFAWAALLR